MAQKGIRIIGGKWKHSVLQVRDLPGLRPTLIRLRKTLADWMRPLQPLSVVDLFAGTGAVGFELASEGATRVVLVERHPLAVADLLNNLTRLNDAAAQIEVIAADSQLWLGEQREVFDLIILDPPFEDDFAAITTNVLNSAIYAQHSKIYSEQPRRHFCQPPTGWKLEKQATSGDVIAQLWGSK